MVMLAAQMKTVHRDHDQALDILSRRGWMFDVKHDGVRAITEVRGGVVTILSRSGQVLTDKFPEVADACAALDDGMYDGELIVVRNGVEDFSGIASRVQSKHPNPLPGDDLRYMIFDLPEHPGTLVERRAVLAWQVGALGYGTVLPVMPFNNGMDAWVDALEDGREGLVAKNPQSRYVNARSPEWVKIKRARRVSAIITGYVPGEGGAAGGVGALLLSLTHDGKLLDWGKCGTGFTSRDRVQLKDFIDQNPDVPLVADIECMELTQRGRPRHPTFRGIRSDLTPHDCTVAQLA